MTETRPAFTGPELCALEAHEVVAMLKRGDITPRDCIDAALARIARVEPAINAIPTLCEDRARAAADALESSAGNGNSNAAGWLAGLPLGIKDLSDVAGVRTTYGTKGYADHIPRTSDTLVTRIESRGGIVIGKTNTPEFGAGANTFNDVLGITRNPWDTTLNPGGSSGGAAASLATGETWLSHGSDHGGSLRTPAGFCGIVGLRPSPGRVAADSNAAFMIEGNEGPMARSARDCALFLDTMAGFDPASPISYPADRDGSFEDAVIRATPDIRIAFSADLNGMAQVDSDVLSHLHSVMHKMQAAGASVEETCPQLPHLERTYHTLRGIGFAIMARRMPADISRHLKATIHQNIARGRALDIDNIADAHLDRTIIYNNMLRLFDDFDVLACPTVGCMPHPQSEEWVSQVGGQTLAGYMDWLRFAFLATTAGLPAISVPVGPGPGGLPIGLQLIGKPRGEAALLAAGRAVEMVVGGPLPPIDPVVTHR